MFAISLCAVVVCALFGCLSRSALAWTATASVALAGGYVVSMSNAHPYLFVMELGVLIAMSHIRQDMNRWWQSVVVKLQIVIATLYVTYTTFSHGSSWTIAPIIHTANVLFLAQVALICAGGAKNSLMNYRYLKTLRRNGADMRAMVTAWSKTP